MATRVSFLYPIVAVQSKLWTEAFSPDQSSPSASAVTGQTSCAVLTQRRIYSSWTLNSFSKCSVGPDHLYESSPSDGYNSSWTYNSFSKRSVGTDHLCKSLQSPSDGPNSSWTYNFYGMHSSRIQCVPLQQLVEPPPKLGHVEGLGQRGLLSRTVGLACSDSFLADTKHLHVRGEGKQLVVCNSNLMVSQSQSRASVIVLNPQRKACVAPETFSPVESEINSVGHVAETTHIDLVEDEAVSSVVVGGVDNWYTSNPGHAVCKPCSTDTFKPHRVRGLPPPQGIDHSLEPLITTVNKSRPSDVRSCLQSVESGIQTGHGQGRDSLAAQIPQVASTKSSFIDLNNVSNSHGLKSIQTGLQDHTPVWNNTVN